MKDITIKLGNGEYMLSPEMQQILDDEIERVDHVYETIGIENLNFIIEQLNYRFIGFRANLRHDNPDKETDYFKGASKIANELHMAILQYLQGRIYLLTDRKDIPNEPK